MILVQYEPGGVKWIIFVRLWFFRFFVKFMDDWTKRNSHTEI